MTKGIIIKHNLIKWHRLSFVAPERLPALAIDVPSFSGVPGLGITLTAGAHTEGARTEGMLGPDQTKGL